MKATGEVEKMQDYRLAHLIYRELSDLYLFRSFYEDGLKNSEKALHYAQLARNEIYIAISFWNLGRATSVLSQMERSIKYYKEVIRISEKIQEDGICADAMNELAGVYTHLHDYDSALVYSRQSLEINRREKKSSLETNYLVFI